MTSIDCTNKLHVCFNYTQSAMDYFGMVTLSSMQRCGRFIYRQLEVDQLIEYAKRMPCFNRLSRKTQIIQPVINESRIAELNLTIHALENRLKQLEAAHAQRDVAMAPVHAHKRKIDNKQKGLLQQILFENKKLKRSSKKLSSEDT